MTKLAANGSTVLYSTYLGADQNEQLGAVAIDDSGNIIISGGTWSSDFPTTAGVFDSTYNGGLDIVITKFTPDGALLFSTFIGGSSDDNTWFSVLDGDNSIIINGWTISSDFPTSSNVYSDSYSGNGDGIIVKLSSDGSTLEFSTFIGGSAFDAVSAFVLDNVGICATVYTESNDFPTTEDAYNKTLGGDSDCAIVKFSTDGSILHYSTYLGGEGYDNVFDIALASSEEAYLCGPTNSTDFPTTPDAYSRTYVGGPIIENDNLDGTFLKIEIPPGPEPTTTTTTATTMTTTPTTTTTSIPPETTPTTTETTAAGPSGLEFLIVIPTLGLVIILSRHFKKKRKS